LTGLLAICINLQNGRGTVGDVRDSPGVEDHTS